MCVCALVQVNALVPAGIYVTLYHIQLAEFLLLSCLIKNSCMYPQKWPCQPFYVMFISQFLDFNILSLQDDSYYVYPDIKEHQDCVSILKCLRYCHFCLSVTPVS